MNSRSCAFGAIWIRTHATHTRRFAVRQFIARFFAEIASGGEHSVSKHGSARNEFLNGKDQLLRGKDLANGPVLMNP